MANYIVRRDTTEQGIVNESLSVQWDLQSTGIAKTGSVEYIVVADNRNTSEESVRRTPGIPRIGQSINGFWCQSVQAEWRSIAKHAVNGNDTWAWTVTCSFDSEFDFDRASRNPDGTVNEDGDILPPIYLPAKFSIHNETVVTGQQSILDADGNRLVNAIGRPYGAGLLPTIETEEETSIIQIERWGLWPVPISQITFYNNTTNQDPFHGLPARTCLMRVRVRKQFYEGVAYAKEQYTIKVKIDRDDPNKEGTWGDVEIPHVSDVYYKDAGDKKTVSTRDQFGQRRLFYIRNDGTRIEEGDDIEYLTFKAKRATPWGPLNLPNQ